MQFVHPLFLIALVAIAIPVIIHLFNFRRFKKVYFTNVRFLQQIEQETKKNARLRQLLILLARILAIASLVIAFAQPFIPYDKNKAKRNGAFVVSVYIDNSFSMEALATNGRLIDIAKTRAREIVAAYAPSDRFQLLTNDFEGRHQRVVNRDDFLKLVEEIKPSPVPRTLQEVIARQSDLLFESKLDDRDAYLISDFQKSTMNPGSTRPDTTITWFLVPLHPEKKENLYIDTAWFESPVHQPGQPSRLKVRVTNAGPETLEKIPVRLTINSVQKAIGSLTLEAGSSAEIILPYTENPAGIQYGMVEINDYPVIFDDHYYFAYQVTPSIAVMTISGNPPDLYLDALFGQDSAFQYSESSNRQIDYGALPSTNLLILNGVTELASGLVQEATGFVRNGGSLVIFPSDSKTGETYRSLFTAFGMQGFSFIDTLPQRVASLQVESDLFNDIFEKKNDGPAVLPDNLDLPKVTKHFVFPARSLNDAEILMRLQNNDPFLVTAPLGEGVIYIFTVPLLDSWSNFQRHLLFLPTLYKIALLSNRHQPIASCAGSNARIEAGSRSWSEKNLFRIRKNNSDFEMIPFVVNSPQGTAIFTRGQIREEGHYTLFTGNSAVEGLGFNYDRNESDLNYFSNKELENLAGKLQSTNLHVLQTGKNPMTRQIEQIRQGQPVWKIFLLLALLFLGTEIALIRLLKG